MALSFGWYSNEYKTEKEIFDFAVTHGGKIQKISDSLSQCTITKNGETIRIVNDEYFLLELEDEDYQELSKHNICPKSSFLIEVGLSEKRTRSIELAMWFSEKLLLKYPNSVIMAFDKFYLSETAGDIPHDSE